MEFTLTDLDGALEFLFARTAGGFRFGLERTAALLASLGDPQSAYPVLHVAGTNGKGSSVATAYALLTARGLRVARYTSPHLVDFRERMMVGDAPIDAARVTRFVDEAMPAIERIGASFFEATTALAFLDFAERGADVAVVEAGLGGRLDSTNVVDPAASGVTSIGLDHTEYLGDTLDAIAGEKAGVFKPNRPAVIGEWSDRIASLLARDAASRGASPVLRVSEVSGLRDVRASNGGTAFTIDRRSKRVALWTPLAGAHQARNAAFAIALVDAGLPQHALENAELDDALARVSIPGRFQRVGKYLFDVAHNPAGIEVLVKTAARDLPRPVNAVLAVLSDKDWRGMITTLAPLVDSFVFTIAPTAPGSRLWDLADVRAFAAEQGVAFEIEENFDAALRVAERGAETVIVTGSFHTVGDAMSRLQVSPWSR